MRRVCRSWICCAVAASALLLAACDAVQPANDAARDNDAPEKAPAPAVSGPRPSAPHRNPPAQPVGTSRRSTVDHVVSLRGTTRATREPVAPSLPPASPPAVSSQTLGMLTVLDPAAILTSPSDAERVVHVASQGASFRVVADDGDWYRVAIPDPRTGRRFGYIEKRHAALDSDLRARRAAQTPKPWLMPMDLSVPTSGFYSNSVQPMNPSAPDHGPASLEPLDLSVPDTGRQSTKKKNTRRD
jgi:hypothetical protein